MKVKTKKRTPAPSFNIGALFRQRRQADHERFTAMVTRSRPAEPTPPTAEDRAAELKAEIGRLQAQLVKLEGGN